VKKIKTLIPASKFGMFSQSLALTKVLLLIWEVVVTDLGGFVASTFKWISLIFYNTTVYGRCP
jgi:3-dehydroquinate synthetase